MTTERRRSLTLCLLLLSSAFLAAFAPTVAADSRVLLDLSDDHLVLTQGDSANVTLTIDNNDTSIRDFDLSVDDSLTAAVWNITLADTQISGVLPTFTTTTTVIVRLAETAVLADGGTADIIVTQIGTNATSMITIHLAVSPSYLPQIDHTVIGDGGLLTLETGDEVNLTVPITNAGSSLDHIVLAVDETADLADFWANYNPGGGGNETNDTGGNGTGGNGTGGNGTNNTNGTGNTTMGPTELALTLNSIDTNLTAALASLNLTANQSYIVDWTLEENGSVIPHDTGLYNWTSDGTNHSWNRTWNLTAGEWCFSATITANFSGLSSVATCSNVTAAQGNGTGNGTSMGRAVPSGWQVLWVDSTLENMSAGESRNATLRISVPLGESPGDYGFLLSAGSAMGNFTISETIVVRVNGTHNLTLSADDGGENWLGNASGTVDFTVMNVGSSEAESIYSLSTVTGVCNATLDAAEADGDRLAAGLSEMVTVDIEIDADAGEGETCSIPLAAWEEIGQVGYAHTYIVTIGAAHNLALVSSENVSLTPGSSSSGTVTVRNTGTESTSLRLSGSEANLSLTTDSAWVSVASGDTTSLDWTVSVDGDTDLVGPQTISLTIETEDGSSTLNLSANLMVEAWAAIRLSGPLGSAFDVGADVPATVTFSLENNGTGVANTSLDWSDAPLGFSISTGEGALIVSGATGELSLDVSVADGVTSGSYDFSVHAVNPEDGSTWDTVGITAHVSQRAEVRLLVASDAKPVSNRADTTYIATVINDGNEPDTFSLSMTGASGFDVDIDPQHQMLNAGQSVDVTVTLRRTGAIGDVTMTLGVTSLSDGDVQASVNLTATVPTISVQVTVATNVESIDAGGTVALTLFLENLGQAEDTLLVTGPSGFGCDHPAQMTLNAGAAASSHAVTCVAMNDLAAGSHWLNFTTTSLTDSSESASDGFEVDIAPARGQNGDPLITVEILGEDWSLAWNASATYTVVVTNAGNEHISGFLHLAGEDVKQLYPVWSMVDSGLEASAFSVAPGASSTYSLTLTATTEPNIGTIQFRIDASGTLSDGQGFAVPSPVVEMTVEHQPAPATEAELWEGGPMVNASNLAIGMLSGWLFAALLLFFIRRSVKLRSADSVQDAWDEAAEEESKDDDLEHGEIRPDEDGTARCHDCSARIRLPTEKEAPFRFKCPTCAKMNRVMPPRDD